MADDSRREQTLEQPPSMDAPVPAPDDPGGAHAKGFSADPRPEQSVPASDPVPLAEAPEGGSGVRVPERDNHVRPTGRSEPHDYTPNDRLMGADR
jgi:hypothetical protein